MNQIMATRAVGILIGICLASVLRAGHVMAADTILQPLAQTPGTTTDGRYYVPSTTDTVLWGVLPNRDRKPVLAVPSGSVVIFDTVSHEGMLEDQGRNPVRFFESYGVAISNVLNDARAIAASGMAHDFNADGPHVVTGPVAIDGAQPGDVLKVEVLSLEPRVPYGVISNRHGKGALPGEFPENDGPQPGASAANPEKYGNVSVFTRVREISGVRYGILHNKSGVEVRFPIEPFMGIMGVAPDTSDRVHSVPPAAYGGNIDIKHLGVGSTLYLPVQIPGANFYVGDPHFAQGNGEVALTALEAPLRASFRLTVIRAGDAAIPGGSPFVQPFAETEAHWIPIGLNEDLDEAMKQAVREAIRFLSANLGMDKAVALAYLSAAGDFEVSQVVDKTKGVHGMIRKRDFAKVRPQGMRDR